MEAPAKLPVRPSVLAPRGIRVCKESGEAFHPAWTAARKMSEHSLAVVLVPYSLLLLLIRILRASAIGTRRDKVQNREPIFADLPQNCKPYPAKFSTPKRAWCPELPRSFD